MASSQHQKILGLLVRQMKLAEYKVFFVEGNFIGCLPDVPKIPPKVLRHRPDALGIATTGQVCIADAKITSDIKSKRIAEQIEDYTSVEINGIPCKVIIGIPWEAEPALRTLLRKLAVDSNPHIHILRVPEELLDV